MALPGTYFSAGPSGESATTGRSQRGATPMPHHIAMRFANIMGHSHEGETPDKSRMLIEGNVVDRTQEAPQAPLVPNPPPAGWAPDVGQPWADYRRPYDRI